MWTTANTTISVMVMRTKASATARLVIQLSPLRNGGFEMDPVETWSQLVPTHWTATTVGETTPRVYIVRSGNVDWGSERTPHGEFYCVLHGSFTSISQRINGLVPDKLYQLEFLALSRPGYSRYGVLTVYANDAVVFGPITLDFQIFPTTATCTQPFSPDAGGAVTLRLANETPWPGSVTPYTSVFLDALRLI